MVKGSVTKMDIFPTYIPGDLIERELQINGVDDEQIYVCGGEGEVPLFVKKDIQNYK